MTTYVLCKTLVPWLCSRSQPGIKVGIRGLSGAFVTYCNISCCSLVILDVACCYLWLCSIYINIKILRCGHVAHVTLPV